MSDNADPGDEDVPHQHPWWRFVNCRTGPCWIGMPPSLIFIRLPEPDHDPGDEDDYHNYVPSTHPTIGLPLWAPRELA